MDTPVSGQYVVQVHKATLYAELERLNQASQDESSTIHHTQFAQGAISALRWLLNEGPAPTAAIGWSEHA